MVQLSKLLYIFAASSLLEGDHIEESDKLLSAWNLENSK